jgi:membrane associated rhomboid family serine protease
LFSPYAIHKNGEWHRFITGGFIHADYMHLAVNMYVLYIFGEILEMYMLPIFFGKLSKLVFVALYVLGIIVSDIPSYFKHRNNSSFLALGASGAVSSIVFASILLNPWEGGIGLLFIPVFLPPVVFGGLYLLYSYIMSRRGRDHINHDAHFYGALFGLIFPGLIKPVIFSIFFQQITGNL